MKKAIALYRVSTYRQSVEGHSLDAQEERVKKAADFLEVSIVKNWRIDASSRAGKNLSRKDLKEALSFCKLHKTDYFIIDEVDRFMRSIDEYYWYKVEFKKYGVKLIFASQPELSEKGQFAKLRELLAVFEAESSNEERSRKTKDKMQARVLAGYYPFFPHQGYRKTESANGLHVPNEPYWSLLQRALKSTAYFEMTPSEAVRWLNSNGYQTRGKRKMDINHFSDIMRDPYYMGMIKVKDWPVCEKGLHKPMLSKAEYETNLDVINGRRVRAKKNHNPEFPLNTLIYHETCVDNIDDVQGKYTGFHHSNGRSWKRAVYCCRQCKKRIARETIHEQFTNLLDNMKIIGNNKEELLKQLRTTWERDQGVVKQEIEHNLAVISDLEARIDGYLDSMSAYPDLADDYRKKIAANKEEIKTLEKRIAELNDNENDFIEFAEFAIDFTENLKDNWWTLNWENRVKCKQLLFPAKILVSKSKNVHTSKISSIYFLENKKNGFKTVQNDEMVELAGTAPASASLSN